MSRIAIDKIIIPENRRRKIFNEVALQELADSIKEIGLVEPIVVEKEDLRLVAGERRIRAHKLLGLTEIEVVFKEELDAWHRKAMELAENIFREDLTWQEALAGKLEVHELYQQKFGVSVARKKGGWDLDATAELLGESHGSIIQDIQLARAMKDDPNLCKKDSKVAAFKAFQVKKELGMKQEIAAVLAGVSKAKGEDEIQIICGDSQEILKEYEDESFDFCVTDPQYGIGVHDMQDTFPNRGDVRQGIEFDDSKPILQAVVKPIMGEVYRILREGSHCYVFFAIARYTEVKTLLQEVGFWVNPCPVFWDKNNALNLRPWLTRPVDYEPCFHCAKGYPPRPFTEIQTTSRFQHPILSGQTKVHPTEKPLPMIKWLIESCSTPKEKGIDPFLGGGTFTLACKEMDRLAVGVEIDKVWWLEAKKKVEGEG